MNYKITFRTRRMAYKYKSNLKTKGRASYSQKATVRDRTVSVNW